MNNNDNNLPIEHFDPSFSNLEKFEAAQGWVEFDCRSCNDTGFDYADNGDKILCSCSKGVELANELEESEPWDGFRDDVEADADALASAGYGTDEDYGYYGDESYEDWN